MKKYIYEYVRVKSTPHNINKTFFQCHFTHKASSLSKIKHKKGFGQFIPAEPFICMFFYRTVLCFFI